MSPAARTLAEWGRHLADDEVPSAVRAAAIRHLTDGVGTALAASIDGAAAGCVRVAAGLGGPPEASLLGTGTKVGAPAAALAAGALVHAHDFDDTHAGGLVHATAVVLPVALAVGQQYRVTGRELVTAAVIGYETMCRVAAATPHAFHARGLHATRVAGVFGAAMVAARLTGLDEEQTTHALGIAGSDAGGLLEFLGSGASTKQLHPGSAAMSGILAARLAAEGATGPATVLEGSRGLYAVMAAAEPDLDVLTGALGERWETTRIGIKPYPACQLMHASLAAIGAVPGLLAGDLDPEEVDSIVVEVHPDSYDIVCAEDRDHTRPASAYDAKFSLPWSLAAMLIDRVVSLSTYRTDALGRPDVAALAGRVRPVRMPADGVVAADAPGRVLVRLRDGSERSGRVRRSPGGPTTPLSWTEFQAKFRANAHGLPGAGRLLHMMEGLDTVTDLELLTCLFTDLVKEASA